MMAGLEPYVVSPYNPLGRGMSQSLLLYHRPCNNETKRNRYYRRRYSSLKYWSVYFLEKVAGIAACLHPLCRALHSKVNKNHNVCSNDNS